MSTLCEVDPNLMLNSEARRDKIKFDYYIKQLRGRDGTDDKAAASNPGDPGFESSQFLFMLHRAFDDE